MTPRRPSPSRPPHLPLHSPKHHNRQATRWPTATEASPQSCPNPYRCRHGHRYRTWTAPTPTLATTVLTTTASPPIYKNCAAARAAGVTPLYAGDPGYSSKLDRDGDGIACE
ncbi:MAG: excalibur calcium-binding domain-containing protein [Pseudonocardiaceae bacterium]